jgi:precorrin-6A/cobalt-precorrin-6A reductase
LRYKAESKNKIGGGQMANIMVIGGTADAREIIGRLAKNKNKIIATVATYFGSKLLQDNDGVEVFEGRLTSHDMMSVISSSCIKCLVDASHPYALEVSLNAINAARQAGIPYLRYERKKSYLDGYNNIVYAADFEQAAYKANDYQGNIFLAIGSRNLKVFLSIIDKYERRVFARVLPDSSIIRQCEAAGLNADNIIAMKGPFSEEINIAMLKHCCASVLVTKDSGDIGGTPEKVSACHKLGIPVILVERPEVDYGTKVSSIEQVEYWVQNYVKGDG